MLHHFTFLPKFDVTLVARKGFVFFMYTSDVQFEISNVFSEVVEGAHICVHTCGAQHAEEGAFRAAMLQHPNATKRSNNAPHLGLNMQSQAHGFGSVRFSHASVKGDA